MPVSRRNKARNGKGRVRRTVSYSTLLGNAGLLKPVNVPSNHQTKWKLPHQGEQEKARRKRQIDRGLTQAWGRDRNNLWVKLAVPPPPQP